MLLRRAARCSAVLVALLACKPAPEAAPPDASTNAASQTAAAEAPRIDPARLRAHLAFLADDAQEGRGPGTPADARVQDHIEQALREHGLKPGFGDSYRQPFPVQDGVRLLGGQTSALAVGGAAIAHDLVPFAHATAEPVKAPVIYVGHGIGGDEPDSGDYKGLLTKVKGAIVVARAGAPDDPHIDPTRARAQSKLIAARDRGAVGFVLWEPDNDTPYPNHGDVNDLQIPAVAVAKAGTPALLQALGARGQVTPKDPHAGLKPGARARKPGALHTPVEAVTLQTANVAGLLPGTGPKRIVLGAHMDHLGLGTSSSLAPGAKAIHNGADDNASGVAALLAVAGALARLPAEARPYELQFVAFGAEEMGLLGSKHMIGQLGDRARDEVAAMINFDMVGRVRDGNVIVIGTGTSSAWSGLVERAASDPQQPGRGLTLKASEDGFGASDQASFYAVGIPVLHFFSGTHEDYHRPSDDFDKIDLDGAARIADMSVRLVTALLRERPTLDFIKVKEAAPGGRAGGGFRVSLGTVPDYAAQLDGVKLSGVRPGSPAEQAGLQGGDVIVKLGAREIHNFDDYMAAFGELKPGVEITVGLTRDGQPLEVKLTPAAPTRR